MINNTERPIDFVVPIALKEVMEALTPRYTSETGVYFQMTSRLNPEVPRYVSQSNTWDVALSNPQYIDEIVAAGLSTTLDCHPFGYAPLALAQRGVASSAAVCSPEEIASVLRHAGDIAMTKGGTSGEAFLTLTTTLDVRHEIEQRIKPMAGGEPMRALLSGEVDMAALPLTNILPIPGVYAVAICPLELNVHIEFSICSNPATNSAARHFVQWLTSQAVETLLQEYGVQR